MTQKPAADFYTRPLTGLGSPSGSEPVPEPMLSEDPRVTQALEDYLTALEEGQLPNRKQFLARYPDIAGPLGEYLEGLEFVHHTAARMQDSSAGGPARLDRVPPGTPEPVLKDYQI